MLGSYALTRFHQIASIMITRAFLALAVTVDTSVTVQEHERGRVRLG